MDFCIKMFYASQVLALLLNCTTMHSLMSLLYNFGSSFGDFFSSKRLELLKLMVILSLCCMLFWRENWHCLIPILSGTTRRVSFFISLLLSSTSSGGIIQRQCQGWFIIKTFFSNYPGYLEREATLRSNCNCNRATLFFAHLLTINNRF